MRRDKTKLREAQDRLSQYQYNVGYHYYRSRWCPGAVDRFKALLKNDPQFTRRDSVYFYLGECYAKANQPAEALPYFDRLIKEFETERAPGRGAETGGDAEGGDGRSGQEGSVNFWTD